MCNLWLHTFKIFPSTTNKPDGSVIEYVCTSDTSSSMADKWPITTSTLFSSTFTADIDSLSINISFKIQHCKCKTILRAGATWEASDRYVRLRSTSNPQIGVQFSNIWSFFTFSNRRPITSLTYTSNDITPIRTWFWNNDGEGTRSDSEYIVLLL